MRKMRRARQDDRPLRQGAVLYVLRRRPTAGGRAWIRRPKNRLGLLDGRGELADGVDGGGKKRHFDDFQIQFQPSSDAFRDFDPCAVGRLIKEIPSCLLFGFEKFVKPGNLGVLTRENW